MIATDIPGQIDVVFMNPVPARSISVGITDSNSDLEWSQDGGADGVSLDLPIHTIDSIIDGIDKMLDTRLKLSPAGTVGTGTN